MSTCVMLASGPRLDDFWSWPGWTPMVAIGTLALALTTGILAGFTAWNVRQTKHLVNAAQDSASAAERTIAEIRRDRELEYQPYLSWRVVHVQTDRNLILDPGRIEVVNFGRGPALYCLCGALWTADGPGVTPDTATPYFATTDLFTLSPNDKGPVTLERRPGWVPDESVTGVRIDQTLPNHLGFCRDHLDNYYRFVPYELTATWREEDSDRPRWVGFYLSHFDALKKS